VTCETLQCMLAWSVPWHTYCVFVKLLFYVQINDYTYFMGENNTSISPIKFNSTLVSVALTYWYFMALSWLTGENVKNDLIFSLNIFVYLTFRWFCFLHLQFEVFLYISTNFGLLKIRNDDLNFKEFAEEN